jgi:RimJ/RimL family protein N-acetyltransferase
MAARFAFEELCLNRLELIIPVGNDPSIRVAEKVGAEREGVLKGRVMLGGRPHDAVSYSIRAADWELQQRLAAKAA